MSSPETTPSGVVVEYPTELDVKGKKVRLVVLPTGKPHVSFSEVSDWSRCSWRHRKKHVEKLDLSKPSVHPLFGKAAHAVLEEYVKTRVMRPEIAFKMLVEEFKSNVEHDGFTVDDFKECVKDLNEIFAEVPTWLDEAFPGWEYVAVEEMLYEQIEERSNAFKGFIDAVIRVPKGNKHVVWLLDWKTVLSYWSAEKKSDPRVTSQLIYYKSFWSKKHGVPMKDIRCAFVLLKRRAKPGKKIEIVPVSVGDKSEARALKVLGNMIATVNRGIAIKNRNECKWCEYKNTEHCT